MVAPWLANLLCLVAGGLHALSLALPSSGEPIWYLQIASLAVLAGLLRPCSTPRQAAWRGWLFATAWLTGSVSWLYTSMHQFGGIAAPLAAAGVLALAGFMALFWALAMALAVWALGNKRNPTNALAGIDKFAIVFGSAWLLAELARTQWLTGFPWGASGYAHVDGPLAAYAPWIGVHGMGWVAGYVAGVLGCVGAWVLRQRSAHDHSSTEAKAKSAWTWFAIGTGPMLALFLVPVALHRHTAGRLAEPANAAGTMTVALAQGNIAQGEKFEPSSGVPLALMFYQQVLREADAQLVVLPETALPMLPQQLPQADWLTTRLSYRAGQRAALVGLPMGDDAAGYTNSVLGLVPGTGGDPATYRYDKQHLVPFGEFIPWGFRWFTDLMHIPLGDFNRGTLGQAPLVWAGQRIAPNICYEDLFGEELAASFVDPAQAPTVLANVSNLAWFGAGQVIDHHLQIARLRTLELERPMLRATNTGATAIINHRGQVTHQLPRVTRGVLMGQVEGRRGVTPYAWLTGRFGLWPFWVCALLTVLGIRLVRGGTNVRS